MLTDAEHEAMELSGQLASKLHQIIGDGPQAANDWNEAAQRIHAIQHMILAQAAARLYPDRYRLMGGLIELSDTAPNDGHPEADRSTIGPGSIVHTNTEERP